MSIFDGKRLNDAVLKLDGQNLRTGYYADQYFENVRQILQTLKQQGSMHNNVDMGDVEVEAQWFTRRAPYALIGGVDVALEMLRQGTGEFAEGGIFVNRFNTLETEAVEDGVFTTYDGDPMAVQPVLKVRGKYRYFGVLETATLGVLSRISRVATNTYHLMKAAHGKRVLFFPARYDLYETQAADGYAYQLGVRRYNHDFDADIAPSISTDAQGAWWDGKGGGTVPHALVASFQGDTPASMLAFAEILPPTTPRIALVDFHNDCVGTSLAVAGAMYERFQEHKRAGNEDEAARYKLNGVRLDTASTMRDVSVEALGDKKLDMGVNPRLVQAVRNALDNAYQSWDVVVGMEEDASAFCRDISIVATGGFSIEKIKLFEQLGVPVDAYGVGSKFFTNDSNTNTDFTMDVVRLKINGEWIDMAKVGRRPCHNPDLKLIQG